MVMHYEDSINKWVGGTEAFSLKTYGLSSSDHCGAAVIKSPLWYHSRWLISWATQEPWESNLCLCFDFTTAGSHILINPLSWQINQFHSPVPNYLPKHDAPHVFDRPQSPQLLAWLKETAPTSMLFPTFKPVNTSFTKSDLYHECFMKP